MVALQATDTRQTKTKFDFRNEEPIVTWLRMFSRHFPARRCGMFFCQVLIGSHLNLRLSSICDCPDMFRFWFTEKLVKFVTYNEAICTLVKINDINGLEIITI